MATIETTILFEKGTGRTKPFEATRVEERLASGEWFRTLEEAVPPKVEPPKAELPKPERKSVMKPERPAAASDEG